MRPYRRGEEENYIAINIQVIQHITPPSITHRLLSDGRWSTEISDPRYWVTFRRNDQEECGRAERDDLIAAGLPLPPFEGDGPVVV